MSLHSLVLYFHLFLLYGRCSSASIIPLRVPSIYDTGKLARGSSHPVNRLTAQSTTVEIAVQSASLADEARVFLAMCGVRGCAHPACIFTPPVGPPLNAAGHDAGYLWISLPSILSSPKFYRAKRRFWHDPGHHPPTFPLPRLLFF